MARLKKKLGKFIVFDNDGGKRAMWIWLTKSLHVAVIFKAVTVYTPVENENTSRINETNQITKWCNFKKRLLLLC